jgi:hypothetical protein
MALDATKGGSPAGSTNSEGMTIELARELLAANISALRASAITAVAASGLLYTATHFEADLRHVDDLVKLGVPPLPGPAGEHVSLATIFNVSQIVSLDRMAEFRADAAPADKERSLDDLILKAVELSEVQITWREG